MTNPSLDTRIPSIKRVNGADVTPKAGPYGAFSAEAYLVFTPDPVLVDCGGPPTCAGLCDNLASLGVSPRDLLAVIGTHYHQDHVGNLPGLRATAPDLPFLIHDADATARVDGATVGSPSGIGRVDTRLVDGQQVRYGQALFEVIHVPGHTAGSAAIGVEVGGLRALFVGDAVHGLYFPQPDRNAYADLETWANSLDRLLSVEFDYMFEGHVFPIHVLGNPSALSPREKADLYGLLERRMVERRNGIPAAEAREVVSSQAVASRARLLITPETWIMELAAQVRGGSGEESAHE